MGRVGNMNRMREGKGKRRERESEKKAGNGEGRIDSECMYGVCGDGWRSLNCNVLEREKSSVLIRT